MGVAVDRLPADAATRRRVSLASLTSIRSVGALLVFCGHAIPALAGSRLAGLDRLLGAGRGGVSWFFMLSGFVLAWSRSTSFGRGPFYAMRAARIVPAHVVVLAVAFVVAIASGAAGRLGPWVASLFLVQAWIPSGRYFFGATAVTWSLSCEVLFYAVSPWLLPALGRLGRRAWWCAIASATAAVLAIAATFPYQESDRGGVNAWVVYIFPVSRLLEFCVGALLGHAVLAGRFRRVSLGLSIVLMALVFPVAAMLPTAFQSSAVGLVPFAFLLVTLARNDLDGCRSVLHHPVLVRCGNGAYAFYLVHVAVIVEVDRRVGAFGGVTRRALFVVAVAFVVSTALAAALYRFVERPAERFLRHAAVARAMPKGVLPAVPAPAAPTDATMASVQPERA